MKETRLRSDWKISRFCGFADSELWQPICLRFLRLAAAAFAKGSSRGNLFKRRRHRKTFDYGTSELESPVFNLDKDENLVGRRDPMSNIFPEVDLSKFDPQTKISRRHARIWRDGTNYLVEDLGSSNGTVVIPVISQTIRLSPHQPHVLADGDKLRLGDTT